MYDDFLTCMLFGCYRSGVDFVFILFVVTDVEVMTSHLNNRSQTLRERRLIWKETAFPAKGGLNNISRKNSRFNHEPAGMSRSQAPPTRVTCSG